MRTFWIAIQGEQAAVVRLPRAMVCLRGAASSLTIANRFVFVATINVRTVFDSG
jgi:hypothetical protein